jgi:Flp pilus assembly protein TadG
MDLNFKKRIPNFDKSPTLAGLRKLPSLRADDRGGSLLEIAFLMPVLLMMLVGAAEMGRVAYYAIEVNSAARAGAEYAAQNHATAANTTNIVLAASTDAANVGALTTTATTSCTCTSGTTITCSNAGTTCTSPARIEEFVQVSTSATISPIFHYPGLPLSYSLSGHATMRVEQ